MSHNEVRVEPVEKKRDTYISLNAELEILDPETGLLRLESDKKAARAYFLEHVNQNTVFHYSLAEKLDYLTENDYYETEVLDKYDFEFIKSLFKKVYGAKHRFDTFLGALKYYRSYTLKTFDGEKYLERFEDRVAMTALYLGNGDEFLAESIAEEIISGRFQPATPTFLNAGKKQRGEMVSCFLLRVEDNMESISRSITSALQLSKRGGGVAFNLTNIRESGAPIKKIQNQSSGVVPIMKLLEDSFSYANQLGARQGAGAVYLNAHHPDIYNFLDTKRENADEKVRIKTLSLGVVIPDITMELVKTGEPMYLFSPYDVERVYGQPFSEMSITEHYYDMVKNPEIRKKKIDSRELLQTIASLQFESGYPYILFEDTANRSNPIDGKVSMSNLCVTGDTRILTDRGYVQAKELYDSQEDFEVIVDNRARFLDPKATGLETVSSTRMVKTGENQPVFKMVTTEGFELKTTDYHKFAVMGENGVSMVPLKELEPGDKVLVQGDSHEVSAESQVKNAVPSEMKIPEFVWQGSKETRFDYLSGLISSDGRITGTVAPSVEIASTSREYLVTVQSLLLSVGVYSRVYIGKAGHGEQLWSLRVSGRKEVGNLAPHIEWNSEQREALEEKLGKFENSTKSPYDTHKHLATVDHIEFVGFEDVYDVCVEDGHSVIFDGVVTSNCSEILQVSKPSTYNSDGTYKEIGKDISCNLGSLNVAKAFDSPNFSATINSAVRALTTVSELSDISSVPSIEKGNQASHAIGLGQMNLHGFFGREHIHYDSPEALDFTNLYFLAVLYEALKASNQLAVERGVSFGGFENSAYADGTFFDKYIEKDWGVIKTEKVKELVSRSTIHVPTVDDWKQLKTDVMTGGLYNQNLQAVPPTGSISYINGSTSSIHPITRRIEIRKEGSVGRAYYPAPHMTNENLAYFKTAYEIGPKAIIDLYAVAQEHVDQGLSLTTFYTSDATTRDVIGSIVHAWKQGVKTLYYVRVSNQTVNGAKVSGTSDSLDINNVPKIESAGISLDGPLVGSDDEDGDECESCVL